MADKDKDAMGNPLTEEEKEDAAGAEAAGKAAAAVGQKAFDETSEEDKRKGLHDTPEIRKKMFKAASAARPEGKAEQRNKRLMEQLKSPLHDHERSPK